MTLRRTSRACSAVLFALLAPILSQAQPVDAGEIAERAIALHQERAKGIAGYTQQVRLLNAGGRTLTFEFRRDTVAGLPVFVSDQASFAFLLGVGREASPSRNTTVFLARNSDRLAYHGVEPVDGRPTHVLRMTEFSGTLLDSLSSLPPLLESFTPEEIRLQLDTATYVPRRVATVGTAVQGGTERELRYELLYRDYREVDGLLHPFLMEGSVTVDFTDEERRQMENQLETLRARLESSPPEQAEQLRRTIDRMSSIATEGITFGAETVGLTVRRR